MKIDRLKPLERIPYFTITGFKQVLNANESDIQRVREMLSRWVKMGHIIRLKRGVYMTRRFYELNKSHAALRALNLRQFLHTGLRHEKTVQDVVDGHVLLDRDAFLAVAVLTEVPFAFLALDQVGQMDGRRLFLASLTEHVGVIPLVRPYQPISS